MSIDIIVAQLTISSKKVFDFQRDPRENIWSEVLVGLLCFPPFQQFSPHPRRHFSFELKVNPRKKQETKMSEEEVFIGSIDQGTTSTRFLIYDRSAKPIGSHQIEFTQFYPEAGYVCSAFASDSIYFSLISFRFMIFLHGFFIFRWFGFFFFFGLVGLNMIPWRFSRVLDCVLPRLLIRPLLMDIMLITDWKLLVLQIREKPLWFGANPPVLLSTTPLFGWMFVLVLFAGINFSFYFGYLKTFNFFFYLLNSISAHFLNFDYSNWVCIFSRFYQLSLVDFWP